MKPLYIIKGDKFGGLSVVAEATKSNAGYRRFVCACECGKTVIVQLSNLTNGHTKSCGCLVVKTCLKNFTIHGNKKRGGATSEYGTWWTMISRCENPNATGYKFWGGRGIKVCKRWRNSFSKFLSDMGKRPKGKTLDRKNNDGDYKPSNCRWATWKQQNNNKQKHYARKITPKN